MAALQISASQAHKQVSKLHLLYFKLEIPNKNLILKNEFIYPCIQFLNT